MFCILLCCVAKVSGPTMTPMSSEIGFLMLVGVPKEYWLISVIDGHLGQVVESPKAAASILAHLSLRLSGEAHFTDSIML